MPLQTCTDDRMVINQETQNHFNGSHTNDSKQVKQYFVGIDESNKLTFPKNFDGGIFKPSEVAALVNTLFIAGFKDFIGVDALIALPYGGIDVVLAFEVPGQDSRMDDEDIQCAFDYSAWNAPRQNDALMYKTDYMYTNANRTSQYKLNRAGVEGLSRYLKSMFVNRQNGKIVGIKESQIIREERRGDRLVATVSGIELYKIFAEFYGSKTEDKSDTYEYNVALSRVSGVTPVANDAYGNQGRNEYDNMNNGVMLDDRCWRVIVQRIPINRMRAIAEDMGAVPRQANIVGYPATR